MDRVARGACAGILASLLLTGCGIFGHATDDPHRQASKAEKSASTPGRTSATPAPKPLPAAPSTRSVPALLLPNVRSVAADALQIQVVGDTRRLRFSASLANVGAGPLVLYPDKRSGCPSGQHPALQALHLDANGDGRFQRGRDSEATRRPIGCMLRHPGHDHWHFDAMASYSLRRAGSDDALVSRDKVSFCLRDNAQVRNHPVVVRREHFGECSRTSRQGISPGWIDIYRADLSGQWLRLPADVDSEVLCLDLMADPLHRLAESEETDNATSVGLEVDGTEVRRVNSRVCR